MMILFSLTGSQSSLNWGLITAVILFIFITQFWPYNVFLRDMGVKSGLLKNFEMIKSKPIEIILFDIIFAICALGLFIILFIVIMTGLLFVPLVVVFNYHGESFIILLLEWLFLILVSSVVETFAIPTFYLFWKEFQDNIQEKDKAAGVEGINAKKEEASIRFFKR
ncbi:MAG: hypothetical protein QXF86_00815 [Candidatus Bilamarchaeaceae archaeon]